MAKPASSDLRKRVILAVLAGQSSRAVARRFNVAPSSPSKWTQHYRETGSFEPRKMGGHRRPLLEPHESFIMTRVTEMSHVTVRGLHDELVQRGIKVAPDTIWRFLRDRGLSHKKSLYAVEQNRSDVVRRRKRWQSVQQHVAPERLVFIDETWIKNQYGAVTRVGSERRTPLWLCARWTLADIDVPCGIADRCSDRALRHRRPDQRRNFPLLR